MKFVKSLPDDVIQDPNQTPPPQQQQAQVPNK
jgi:hypothetical protein